VWSEISSSHTASAIDEADAPPDDVSINVDVPLSFVSPAVFPEKV